MIRGLVAFVAALAAVAPAASASSRHWTMTLAPAPSDYTLAEVSFPHQGVSRSTLGVAVRGSFGADYLAVAGTRHGRSIALVLLVNRPTALADPASVPLSLRARRALGAPRTLKAANPFASARPAPGVCSLDHLEAADLRAVGGRGTPLAGFDVAGAVAAGYDAACGLPYPPAFEADIRPACPASETSGVRAECCPPGVECVKQPGCTPCNPPPGYACPLLATPDICVKPQTRASY
jgi:hypothetical protein